MLQYIIGGNESDGSTLSINQLSENTYCTHMGIKLLQVLDHVVIRHSRHLYVRAVRTAVIEYARQ